MSKIYFGYEKLDVYRLSLKYVSIVYELSNKLKGHNRHARDQWLRASQSIPLNIAEGNGKTSEGDRRRFFEIARGSAFECAAIQDIIQIGNAITDIENNHGKELLHRIASMLTKLGSYSYKVKEDAALYQIYTEKSVRNIDYDYDYDIDKIEDISRGKAAVSPPSTSYSGSTPHQDIDR